MILRSLSQAIEPLSGFSGSRLVPVIGQHHIATRFRQLLADNRAGTATATNDEGDTRRKILCHKETCLSQNCL